jgi:predicted acylesterase/phospholipase RssA
MNSLPGPKTPSRKPPKEVRYAVVLNGGVSLAVWMGGVTHELNRLRLASGRPEQTDPPGNGPSPWTEILQIAERTAVVDLIAGTSAGGLNGAVLATAVARGADLPDMRDVWKTVASLDVGRLTRQETDDANSLLNGDYFERKVQDILTSIVPEEDGQKSPAEPRQCTFLVTATALDSAPVSAELETGARMWLRDGRRVYQFTKVLGSVDDSRNANSGGQSKEDTEWWRQDDFASDSPAGKALALAARASASFPAAFTPVWETPELVKQRVRPLDHRVGPRWLVDGGVLDNAPFEPLIEALRERAADEPYDRILLYITPAVGEGSGRRDPTCSAPTLGQTLGSVMNASRETDQRLDSDSISQIFKQMSYSKSQPHNVIAEYLRGKLDPGKFKEAAHAVFTYYRMSRAEAFQRSIDSVADNGSGSTLAPPTPPEIDPDHVPGMPDVCFPVLDGTQQEWRWGVSVADRVLRWWTRAMSELDPPSPEFKKTMQVVANAQRQVTEMYSDLEEAASGKPREQQLEILRDRYLMGPESWSCRLYSTMKHASEAAEAGFKGSSARTLLELSISVEVLSSILNWAGDDYDVPEFRYHSVTPAVQTPPGVDIGPVGCQRDWSVRKLYGERLNHFGAFINEDGRMHDWLWGRLDGASELSKQLLKPQIQAGELTEAEALSLRTKLIREILESESKKLESDGRGALDIKKDAKDAYDAHPRMLVRRMAHYDKQVLNKLDDTLWTLARNSLSANPGLRISLSMRVGRFLLRREVNKWLKGKSR